jgi:UPF0716 protein FxsA
VLAVLVLVFVVLPIVELTVIVQVAGEIGVPETILLLIAVSVVGAWLCKREGLGVLRRIQAALDRQQLPHREVVDGALILFAGVLLVTPGFLTDLLGIVLLLPPTRALVRASVLASFRRRGRVVTFVSWGFGTGRTPVHDTTGRDGTGGGPVPQGRSELEP